MGKQLFRLTLFGCIVISLTLIVVAQRDKVRETGPKGVPELYAGNWICQTFQPGYDIVPPHADLSQPATSKITTPGAVAVLKFTLRGDGKYEAAHGRGRYSFEAATNQIEWLDGPHRGAYTKTEVGKRSNGAPKIGLVVNKRYYGCYMAKRQKRGKE